MVCVSACMKMDDGRIQTGDTSSEPSSGAISVTAPVPRDAAYEARSAICERPSCARLRGGNPVQKRSAFGTRRPRGRLKCRRVSDEFGTRGFPCGRVCGASCAACHVFCSRNAWSGSTGRYARVGLYGKPCRFGVRVSSPGISRHESRVRSARFTWGTTRKRAPIAMRRATTRPQVSSDGRDERASRRLPPWRYKKKKSLAPSTRPQPGCGKHPALGIGAIV